MAITPSHKMAIWICENIIGAKINEVPKYECQTCMSRFNEPKVMSVSASCYYGVFDDFGCCGSIDISVCPSCESEEFIEIEEYEDEEEE